MEPEAASSPEDESLNRTRNTSNVGFTQTVWILQEKEKVF